MGRAGELSAGAVSRKTYNWAKGLRQLDLSRDIQNSWNAGITSTMPLSEGADKRHSQQGHGKLART